MLSSNFPESEIESNTSINNNLKDVVKKLGINSNQFDKCINDEVIEDKILNGRIDGQKKYSINSTPTVIINEKKLKGPNSFESIKKEIEKLIWLMNFKRLDITGFKSFVERTSFLIEDIKYTICLFGGGVHFDFIN